MKLVIKSGESVDRALHYLTEFFNSQKEQYPLLKSNMNIYITLEGFGHKECPDNSKEYILTEEGIVDVEELEMVESKKMLSAAWSKYVKNQIKTCKEAMRDVESAKSSLESAEKRGLKPQTIETRKRTLSYAENELKEAEKIYKLTFKLDKLIEEGKAKIYLSQSVQKNKPYTRYVTAHYVFEDINGSPVYFAARNGQYGWYGSLYSGLPEGYISED